VFDHFRGNLIAADLFAQSTAAAALAAAEQTFPVLAPVPVLDQHPLLRPPALPDVPRPPLVASGIARPGVFLSALMLAAGVVLLSSSRRSPVWSGGGRPETPCE